MSIDVAGEGRSRRGHSRAVTYGGRAVAPGHARKPEHRCEDRTFAPPGASCHACSPGTQPMLWAWRDAAPVLAGDELDAWLPYWDPHSLSNMKATSLL